MEDLVYLALFFILAGFFIGAALGGVAFLQLRRLRRDLRRLEARLEATPAGALAPARRTAEPLLEPLLQPISAPIAAAEPPAQTDPVLPPLSEAPPREPASAGLEEALGVRWAVWIGGLAIALGGIFLVRYSVEAGLLGPGARVLLGLALGVLLIAASEWLRRRTPVSHAGDGRPYVPGGLAAAGIAVVFGAIYAAHALYGLIGPAAAFLLLGAAALAGMALALRHGPALAGLGFAASYATPLLVSSEAPVLGPVVAYLVVVTAAALALARARGWLALAVTAALGSILWGLALAGAADPASADPAWLAAYDALAFGLAVLAFAATSHPARPEQPQPGTDRVAVAVLSAFALPVFLVLAIEGAELTGLALVVVIGAAMLGTAIEWPPVRGVAVAATVLVVLGFLAEGAPLAALATDPLALDLADVSLAAAPGATRLLGTAAVLGGLFGALGLFGAWRSAARGPVAIAGAFIPVGVLVVAYLRLADFRVSVPFGLASLLLALALAAATEFMVRRVSGRFGADAAAAAYAVGALAAVAAGLTMLTERGVLTLLLALMVAGVAFVERFRPLSALRWVALALAAVVALRFVIDPRVVGADVGTRPVFNPLLWGYGVPALSFGVAAVLLGRRRQDLPVLALQALAITFATLCAGLVAHHAVRGGDVFAPVSGLADHALLALVALAIGLGLQRLSAHATGPVLAVGGPVLAALGGLQALVGLLVLGNPWITGEPVGQGLLALGYLLPAVVAGILARAAAGAGWPQPMARAAWWLAGVLAAAWVTLVVRRSFQGPVLDAPAAGDGELYAYSAVWLFLGIALLALGLAMRARELRFVSAGIVLAVVAKVFLVDMAALTGLLRAASFLGLGLVLIAVALVYQRLLFRLRPSAA